MALGNVMVNNELTDQVRTSHVFWIKILHQKLTLAYPHLNVSGDLWVFLATATNLDIMDGVI